MQRYPGWPRTRTSRTRASCAAASCRGVTVALASLFLSVCTELLTADPTLLPVSIVLRCRDDPVFGEAQGGRALTVQALNHQYAH